MPRDPDGEEGQHNLSGTGQHSAGGGALPTPPRQHVWPSDGRAMSRGVGAARAPQEREDDIWVSHVSVEENIKKI